MCVKRFKVSERRACQSLGVHRSTIRYELTQQPEEQRLVAELHRLSREHPFYGYKKVWALLRRDGWVVNRKRVERLWRLEGLTIPPNQASGKPAEGSIDNAVWKVRAERPNHVWALDFVTDRTKDGKRFRVLNIVDEFTRECIYSHAERSIGATRVRAVLAEVMLRRGKPTALRSDNGREFVAATVAEFLEQRGIQAWFRGSVNVGIEADDTNSAGVKWVRCGAWGILTPTDIRAVTSCRLKIGRWKYCTRTKGALWQLVTPPESSAPITVKVSSDCEIRKRSA